MRQLAFCICENKDADQLHGNREADQCLCFRYTDSTIPLLPNFKPLGIFSGCTALFVSDLVGNPENWFSHDTAHIIGIVKGNISDLDNKSGYSPLELLQRLIERLNFRKEKISKCIYILPFSKIK